MSIPSPDDDAEVTAQLRSQLDLAVRAAREAHRDTTRLVRLLTVIARPSRPSDLVDEVLRVLSEVYSADVVCLVRTDEHRLVITDACGLPESDPDLGVPFDLPADAAAALDSGRPLSSILTCPLLSDAGGDLSRVPLHAAAWVPLLGDQPTEQLLLLARAGQTGFTGQELDILHSVASRLRVSLSEGQRGVALERLARQGLRIADHLDRTALLGDTVGLLAALSGARAAWVLTRDRQTWEVAASHDQEGLLATLGVADDTCRLDLMAGHVGGAVTVQVGHAVLTVPVSVDGEVRAMLVAADRAPFHYPKATVEAITILAGHLASALVNQALYCSVQQGEASLRLITDSISDLVTLVEPDGRLQYASPSYERQLGLAPHTLTGSVVTDLVHPEDAAAVSEALYRAAQAPTVEYRLRTADGRWVWVETAVRPAAAAEASLVLSSRIIDERKRLEAELRHQATHDALTGMANRVVAAERLQRALTTDGPKDVGLLFCDIDHFKSINDRLGHEAGDQLLRQVAERLHKVVRPTDLLARFGGDEFVVVLPQVDGLSGVDRVGQRVIEAMRTPFVLLGESVKISVSVGGVARASGMRSSATEMMRDADAAMYVAKAGGRDRLQVSDDDASSRALDRLDLRRELERGIDLAQLDLHYQPIVSLASGRVIAYEALLRWHHPTRGLVPPDVFIPIAEETGALGTIGAWTLQTALNRLARWRTEWNDPALEMHVNVSACQLDDPGFVERILHLLRSEGIAPSGLWMEITERRPLTGDMLGPLEALRARGVRVALDDFGVSTSNLELLRLLTPDCLKIDRSFVSGLTEGNDAERAVVRAMISMGEWMKLRVVAEGVETEGQLAVLRQMGCPSVQGYLLGRPRAAAEIGPPMHHEPRDTSATAATMPS